MSAAADFSVEFLRGVLDAAPEAMAVCTAGEGDCPVVYVNRAFEQLSGYAAAELLGQDLRRLQRSDREQPGLAGLRQALAAHGAVRAQLRNYRKDNTPYWVEISIAPLRDRSGAVTHFIGCHRGIAAPERTTGERGAGGMPAWLREDRLTGLHTRAWFEELLRHDWHSALREQRELAVLMFDFVALGLYNDTFGRQAGDACIRRLAGVIGACFRRGSDVVARWEGGTLVALVRSTAAAKLERFAQMILQRVLDQRIHHPRLLPGRYVAVSASLAILMPDRQRQPESLLRAAGQALRRARADPTGRIVVAGGEDFG